MINKFSSVNHSIAYVLICVLLAGCATPTRRESISPTKHIRVEASQETEAELKRQRVSYIKDYKGEYLYIEKPSPQKTGDNSTQTYDTLMGIVAIEAIAVMMYCGILALSGGCLILW
jgi:hypothetical protein